MPLYEFTCAKCGKDFEELCKADDAPTCPHCGAKEATKHMSACARKGRGGSEYDYSGAASGGCGSCSGGNCASCCH